MNVVKDPARREQGWKGVADRERDRAQSAMDSAMAWKQRAERVKKQAEEMKAKAEATRDEAKGHVRMNC